MITKVGRLQVARGKPEKGVQHRATERGASTTIACMHASPAAPRIACSRSGNVRRERRGRTSGTKVNINLTFHLSLFLRCSWVVPPSTQVRPASGATSHRIDRVLLRSIDNICAGTTNVAVKKPMASIVNQPPRKPRPRRRDNRQVVLHRNRKERGQTGPRTPSEPSSRGVLVVTV